LIGVAWQGFENEGIDFWLYDESASAGAQLAFHRGATPEPAVTEASGNSPARELTQLLGEVLHQELSPVAELVLLAAPTGTWIVPTDFGMFTADSGMPTRL